MLKTTRWLHKWIGILLSIVLCVMGLTGFLLNHKDWIERKWQRAPDARRGTPYGLLSNQRAAEVLIEAATACDRLEADEVKVKRVGSGFEWEVQSPGRETVRIRNGRRLLSRRSRGGDLKDLVEDLHKGKFWKPLGPWLVDAAGLSMIVLSVTGLCLWVTPAWRRRKRRRDKRQRADSGA